MIARTLMVQGTSSSVGKSILVTALCRILRNRGLRVAPFKSQNMALNASVTPDGGEIGRAQAVQADACGIAPTVDMNPILLKPEGDARSQVVVLGRPIGRMTAREYHARKPDLAGVIAGALRRLRETHDVVVIEGAGSPAEINLKDRDIVNMHVAREADAPVLLVGDIDRGGVLAAFVGTMELLEPDERARVRGFVVNKFRGDVSLLRPGLEAIEKRTGVPVLGVVPYVHRLRVADEDSVSLESRRNRAPARDDEIEIAVVRLPRISNYDDFEPLEHEPGVVVRFVEHARDVVRADLVVVPGTKTTMADLAWMRESGIAAAIEARAAEGAPVLGVCGGCQMLGQAIEDPQGVEGATRETRGLGLLAVRTTFGRSKTTARVQASLRAQSLFGARFDPVCIDGYEIHMGELTHAAEGAAPLFRIDWRNSEPAGADDGAIDARGTVAGTMIHGVFDHDGFRRAVISALRARRGLPALEAPAPPTRGAEYDRLAAIVSEGLDLKRVLALAGLTDP